MTLPAETAILRFEYHTVRIKLHTFQDELRLLHEGDKETRSLMRALHEQVMARLDSLSGGDRLP